MCMCIYIIYIYIWLWPRFSLFRVPRNCFAHYIKIPCTTVYNHKDARPPPPPPNTFLNLCCFSLSAQIFLTRITHHCDGDFISIINDSFLLKMQGENPLQNLGHQIPNETPITTEVFLNYVEFRAMRTKKTFLENLRTFQQFFSIFLKKFGQFMHRRHTPEDKPYFVCREQCFYHIIHPDHLGSLNNDKF